MIISKFFGLILMLIGGFLLFLSGGCVFFGVSFLLPGIFSGIFAEKSTAFLTLLGLVLGWTLTKNGYRILTKKKEPLPQDVTPSEQEVS